MTLFDEWPHKWYGFCRGENDTHSVLPLLSELVDTAWRPANLQNILAYLRTAPAEIAAPMENATCNLCGKDIGNPSVQLGDDEWAWPLRLSHLVEEHHVRLPDAFVDHIRNRQYIPTFLD
jgi:hypothetical protein